MTAYVTRGPRRGPNGTAPPVCPGIDHTFKTVTGHTFCTKCNLPYSTFIGGTPWPR